MPLPLPLPLNFSCYTALFSDGHGQGKFSRIMQSLAYLYPLNNQKHKIIDYSLVE